MEWERKVSEDFVTRPECGINSTHSQIAQFNMSPWVRYRLSSHRSRERETYEFYCVVTHSPLGITKDVLQGHSEKIPGLVLRQKERGALLERDVRKQKSSFIPRRKMK